MVIHMVTAADGARDYFNDKNIESAIQQDEKRRNAWNGHTNFHIIRNKEGMSFREKIDCAWNFVAHMVGLPT